MPAYPPSASGATGYPIGASASPGAPPREQAGPNKGSPVNE